MYYIFYAKRMICTILCIFTVIISVRINAHETAAQYELQPIKLPSNDSAFTAHINPAHTAPATILAALAVCTNISCGPFSCSIPALVGAAYYTYQWWKHRKQEQPQDDTALLHADDDKNSNASGHQLAHQPYLLLMQRTLAHIAVSQLRLEILSEIDGHPVRFDVFNPR